MEVAFLEKPLKYDGRQLVSHFAYREADILGDSAVAFLGPCEVELSEMVDLEDVKNQKGIYSPLMLHFLLESFSLDLKGGVLFQRICVMKVLEELGKHPGIPPLERQGDDLYNGEKKLNVSIATRSPVSTLIHLGINVQTKGTPVPTSGLEDWKIEPEKFGRQCLESFQKEYHEILKASYKVRGVGTA